MRISSGVTIRESEVKSWLKKQVLDYEHTLVSTKPNSQYTKKLESLPKQKKLIVDLYTPILLEKELTLSRWKPQDWLTRWRNKQMVKKFLLRGNHFLVANRRQTGYWIRTASGLGVKLRQSDISVLPTGSGQFQISNFKSQISARRNVVLWFGGIYPWLDPWPLVEAFGKLSAKFPDWKLRFLGGWHPETGYKGIYRRLKEFGKQMIPQNQLEFIPWQKEKDLGKYLKDVAFAVHLVKPGPEDCYAHRVRLLTLLNSGIGVSTSGRDVISDLLTEKQAGGRVVKETNQLTKQLLEIMESSIIFNRWRQPALTIQEEFIKQEKDIKWPF